MVADGCVLMRGSLDNHELEREVIAKLAFLADASHSRCLYFNVFHIQYMTLIDIIFLTLISIVYHCMFRFHRGQRNVVFVDVDLLPGSSLRGHLPPEKQTWLKLLQNTSRCH